MCSQGGVCTSSKETLNFDWMRERVTLEQILINNLAMLGRKEV